MLRVYLQCGGGCSEAGDPMKRQQGRWPRKREAETMAGAERAGQGRWREATEPPMGGDDDKGRSGADRRRARWAGPRGGQGGTARAAGWEVQGRWWGDGRDHDKEEAGEAGSSARAC